MTIKLKSRTIIEEYRYDTEEERSSHVAEKEEEGFVCSGQVKNSDDMLSASAREFYWYAKFSKQSV